MKTTPTVLNAMMRPLLEAELPDWVDPHWFGTTEELLALAPRAQIGWFDSFDLPAGPRAAEAAVNLRWLNTIHAGVDAYPLDLLNERGVVMTNGAGINAVTIAEYVIMALLVSAKGYSEVVRAVDRQEWLAQSPGTIELQGSRALLIGHGEIGKLVVPRLAALGVEVVPVTRSGAEGTLGPDQWKDRLGEFDWVILALPATPETAGLIGATELAAMKPTARIVNVSRGDLIDQQALIAAVEGGTIGGAFLDTVTPEPLPAGHPLWTVPGIDLSLHLAGRAQNQMFQRSARRFLDNLDRWERGEAVHPRVDLSLGY